MVKKKKTIKKRQKTQFSLMSKNSLELLIDISIIVGGKNAGQIVDLLYGKKNVNEFLIAKKLGLTINQARNILYKLSDEGLVSSVRKKDRKKGWYTYFWTYNVDKALILLKRNLEKDIDGLEHQLKSREVKRFYNCKTCNSEVSEENALLHEFSCPECGEIYELSDNTHAISEIKLMLSRLRKKLRSVEAELNILDEKRIKKLDRRRKREEKEKTAKRKKAADARKRIAKAIKEKLEKKSKIKKLKKEDEKVKKKPVKRQES